MIKVLLGVILTTHMAAVMADDFYTPYSYGSQNGYQGQPDYQSYRPQSYPGYQQPYYNPNARKDGYYLYNRGRSTFITTPKNVQLPNPFEINQ